MTGWFERVEAGPRLRMPLLVRLTAAFAGFWSVCAVLAMVGIIAAALVGRGSFELNGEAVTREQFLRGLPRVLLVFGALTACFAALAAGVWHERAWVRPAVLTLWVAVSALLVGQGIAGAIDLPEALIWSAIYLGFVGWYFYRKPNVVSYYWALEMREHHPAKPADTDPRAAV